MIQSRNRTAHTYQESVAAEIASRVQTHYRTLFQRFLQRMTDIEARA